MRNVRSCTNRLADRLRSLPGVGLVGLGRRAATAGATATILVSATLIATLASAGPAAAAPTTTYTFGENTQGQSWTVPAGVTSGTFDVIAATGQSVFCHGSDAGLGGETTATIPLIPGEVLQVNVGDSYYGEVNSGNASDVRRGAFGLA